MLDFVEMAPSEHTRCKTGALANVMGNFDSPFHKRLVELKASEICGGLGVFACKTIWPNTIITEYASVLMDNSLVSDHEYAMEAVDKKQTHVGISDISKLKGRGIAQFANDAISPLLSGKENNATLFSTSRGPYLRATSKILPGEEILAAYGFGYWKSRIGNHPSGNLDYQLIRFIETVKIFEEAIQKFNRNCKIYRVKSLKNDILEIILENDFYKCPYAHVAHFDDNLFLRLHKISEDRCEVYQKCVKCGKGNHLLLTYDLVHQQTWLKDRLVC